MEVVLKNLTKIFPSRNRKNGDEVVAVNDMNITIPDGKLVGLLGPSGCGKSTTLYMISGLQKVTGGQIFFGDDDVTHLTPENRGVGLVFQNYALYPHLTVKQNIMFPLENLKGADRLSKEEMLKRTVEAARLVQIDDLLARKPSELSGGQQQRVALARALVIEPSVLLFDEPLSNLDAKLRVQMRTEIRRIQQEVGITAIYVTHDQSEAMAISDNIIIMNKGVVAQMGTPEEIYYHPVDEFVADFIGEANFLKGKCSTIDGKYAVLDFEGKKLTVPLREGGMEKGKDYTAVLRPEAAKLGDEGGLECKVEVSCFMGSYQNYHVKIGDTLIKLEDHNPKNRKVYKQGETCSLLIDTDSLHVL